MEELLPYYERELAFLRRHSREFAERYPKIAAQLLISGEGCDDPHVERMIESFALLSARVTKKLEDGYPEFTEALLNVLYPHYLRPFPACSIAHFDAAPADVPVSSPVRIERGTELHSRPIRGVNCRFRTAWEVELAPVRITQCAYEAVVRAPAQSRLPAGSCGALVLTVEASADREGEVFRKLQRLRVHIDAEPSPAAALRDALFRKLAEAHAVSANGQWERCRGPLVGEVGFAADEALIDMPDNAHPAYRHLTEFFAFPEKYNFFDIDLTALPDSARAANRLSLRLILRDVLADGDEARLLQTLTEDHLRLGCVPVVNLFAMRADPIRLTHHAHSYPVVADARRAHAYEVHAIEAVQRIRQTGHGEGVTDFRPFFSLHHGEAAETQGNYWYAKRNPMVAERNPGYETELSLVDANFDPLGAKVDVLSLQLLCTNRELPTQMVVGMPSGDLFLEGGSPVRAIRLLRKPTPPRRFDHRGDGQWRLISHLTLNQLSLSTAGLPAFKEMLSLYDLPRTPGSRRVIEGVIGIEQRAMTVWLPGRPFGSFVRGAEVRLAIDEDSFVGIGIDKFARCMDRFLGLYAHLNGFIQLVVLSGRTGEELIRCEPRTGESTPA